MDSTELKTRHRQIRDNQPDALRTRLHRAISWLTRAEREADDPDAQYIFLWIAFNAAYASEYGFEQPESDQANAFIEKLLQLDTEQRLHHALFKQFSGPIRTLIDNRYVFSPFWRAVREHQSDGTWKDQFEAANKRATYAVMQGETGILLSIVLSRLYVLRNQLVHGAATWGSRTNRAQVKDGVAILGVLVPTVIDLLLRAGPDDFDQVAYPVI